MMFKIKNGFCDVITSSSQIQNLFFKDVYYEGK